MILFYLNENLKVYKVKDSGKKTELELVDFILKEDKYLNLSEKFSTFWQKLWKKDLENEAEIFYLISPNSGFTDTRIIFIWLKTWQFFEPKLKFFVHKIENDLVLENLNFSFLQMLIRQIQEKNNQELIYSKDPNIGKNKV